MKKLEQRSFFSRKRKGTTQVIMELDTSSTKNDLNAAVSRLDIAMRDQTITIVEWVSGVFIAEDSLVVALIQSFKYGISIVS